MKWTRREFVIAGATGAAATGVAGALVWRYLEDPDPGPPLIVRPFEELEEAAFQVCIIGSGPAGAALGLDLARRGIRTAILESGLPVNDDLGPSLRARLDRYRSVGPVGYPLFGTRLRALGGTSNLWTGRCSRLHPLDFEANDYSPRGVGWPITYDDMQDYYVLADETLRVVGGRAVSGRPPRSEGFPERVGPFWDRRSGVEGLERVLADADLAVDYSPTSSSSHGQGPLRSQRDLLPHFTSRSEGTLVVGAHAQQLTFRAGRVDAVQVAGPDGAVRAVRAEHFVLACGGAESTRMLLISLPDAAERTALGAAFMEHPNLDFRGTVPGLATERFELGRSHDVYDSLKREGFGSAILVFQVNPNRPGWFRAGATLEMAPVLENRLRLAPDNPDDFGYPGLDVDLRFTDRDHRTFDRVRELLRDVLGRVGATKLEEGPVTWSHHHLGGCTMGADPRDSVVDGDLRVHGTDNLFVLSSAAFRTGGAAHPTLTIVALAHRLADHLTGTRRESEGRPTARSAP